ncbi:tRNA 5-methoxyuridine(34)/uridine 5-oxyacetic acid(34) synthase CmoB [Campylobacter corcagiensis]|uniref:tRNA 5-methoxyuridine(34)/uridine 5-oxyacetic acid(34) synthase CmoB n=1 Tax=Campylobacter corcagiensis TaxID=1448857 RepID=A0A7M1LEI2_9BACT|nr:tRNA 5-methoxyuridine(34)/uridine 5-oxyacetic acid(34) synthase CmoB [Campylobacter corcagiensis]QKF64861.1 tRNA (cmo5U34)-carboxymethyltransferase [Campylobacter corcagiensis]QOQ86979.1 tRNA 5-methoxyuridine(34)/uridine 5-oxyacetic acid(34) synthase CmoB [Campylobacter corcagiensis]
MNLDEIRTNNLKALNYEIYKDSINKINSLKSVECEVEFDKAIKISGSVSDEFKNLVYEACLSLKPWRKGPFELFDTYIDSEWQSNIKYEILEPFLNLEGKVVADIGCNNGYYLFRMLKKGAKKLVGFDPSIRTFLQFKFIDKFVKSGIVYELLGVEHLAFYEHKFDTILCLGVIYHRSDPVKMLKDLKSSLNKGGEVILDTMYIDSPLDIALVPNERYSKMSNVYFIPTISALKNWCKKAKFKEFEVLATKDTDENEQRKTEWIDGESLGNFLDKDNKNLTVEGYPAPKRVYIRVKN